MKRTFGLVGALVAAIASTGAAMAQPVSLQDSFRIGSGSSLLCSAQTTISDRVFENMFDRGYSITCRDAAVPVGSLYALRARDGDPEARLAAARSGRATCEAAQSEQIEGLGTVQAATCRLTGADVAYRVYTVRMGNIVYAAEGLGGYDSVLRLGLRSVAADRVVPGEIEVATTGAGDPTAFARVQASSLDPQRALDEAYRRNNAGNYAESAEFFGALTENRTDTADQAEAVVNEALQKSNLGRYGEADTLFARAEALSGGDPVNERRLRNYRAMHLLNQGLSNDALAELDRRLAGPAASDSVNALVIDRPTAARLTAESPGARRLNGLEGLTPEDKAQILDGQALQLRGTVLRLQGRPDEAVTTLNRALDNLVAIRGGRIAATVWMRAQILGELARIAEAQGNQAEAERQHLAAITLLQGDYPESSALFSAKGRLAAYYVRTGREAAASGLYREIVASIGESDSSPTLRRLLNPYFGLLVARGGEPEAAADFFTASQLLVRPGVAQTQAVLARELSGGSDEAASLFRQSVNLTRDVERARVDLARLEANANPSAAQSQYIGELRGSLGRLQQDQVATQARLAEFPRYRAVATSAITLADLQALLRPGEAYYKMLVAGDDAYALLATRDSARAFRLGVRPAALEQQVDALRRTITVVENGQQITYPFDLDLAYQMYEELFAPVSAEIGAVRHLIFEPDGAMLRLPPNVLVTDRAGIEAYRTRAANPEDDGFDFRGVEWLGRERDISTAVSARAFRDVRTAPPSRATGEYLGFGQNATTQGFLQQGAGTRGGGDCDWSLAAWNRPISARELYTAQSAIGGSGQGTSDIVTGEAFTDTAIKSRENLNQYRILHFATHGLVAPPRPECPAQPALLTSFGGADSDGLLTFSEIFDLRLDADIIILSACDTAARASESATQAAGLTSGGDFALDGLVRAFVGAGGRIVVASHWPVPDDFNATERLISGLFTAPQGTGTASALRTAQLALMNEAATSHPYYWAGFAVVGDGVAPVIRPVAPAQVAMAR